MRSFDPESLPPKLESRCEEIADRYKRYLILKSQNAPQTAYVALADEIGNPLWIPDYLRRELPVTKKTDYESRALTIIKSQDRIEITEVRKQLNIPKYIFYDVTRKLKEKNLIRVCSHRYYTAKMPDWRQDSLGV